MGEKDLGRKLCFFFFPGALFTQSWYKRACTAYGHRGKYKSQSLPLILSIFSAEQEAGAVV